VTAAISIFIITIGVGVAVVNFNEPRGAFGIHPNETRGPNGSIVVDVVDDAEQAKHMRVQQNVFDLFVRHDLTADGGDVCLFASRNHGALSPRNRRGIVRMIDNVDVETELDDFGIRIANVCDFDENRNRLAGQNWSLSVYAPHSQSWPMRRNEFGLCKPKLTFAREIEADSSETQAHSGNGKDAGKNSQPFVVAGNGLFGSFLLGVGIGAVVFLSGCAAIYRRVRNI
jgi:hypothetical protein